MSSVTPELIEEIRQHVAKKIGPTARPKAVLVVPDLPKTRSGKIMRRLLRDVAEGRDLGDTTTLADAGVVDDIRRRAGRVARRRTEPGVASKNRSTSTSKQVRRAAGGRSPPVRRPHHRVPPADRPGAKAEAEPACPGSTSRAVDRLVKSRQQGDAQGPGRDRPSRDDADLSPNAVTVLGAMPAVVVVASAWPRTTRSSCSCAAAVMVATILVPDARS